jgi:hypothetical protein
MLTGCHIYCVPLISNPQPIFCLTKWHTVDEDDDKLQELYQDPMLHWLKEECIN